MKKSTQTPKELFQRRVAKNQLMKIPLHERNVIDKENEKPKKIHNIQRKVYHTHDRQLKQDDNHNPFDLPSHMRIFTQKGGRKPIKSEPFIMYDPHTICDVDETFYKIIEGRPLRQFADVKVYMRNIRDITLFMANTAYLKDQILQIDMALTDEVTEYKRIDVLFYETKKNFVQFAKESYEKAKAVQDIAEGRSLEVSRMTDQLENYSFRYVNLRNKLSALAATFQTLSKYRKFLNLISPITWQEEYEKDSNKKSVLCIPSSRNDVASSSAALIDTYKPSSQGQMPLRMYFKKPRELMHVYEDLSRQCLNYMEIGDFSYTILASVQKRRDCLKESVLAEIDEMKGFVDIYDAHVAWLEEKAVEYKSIFDNLLEHSFYELFASYDTSKLFTCVQYVSTQIFGDPEDPKDKISALMLNLESLYVELTAGLDNLDQTIVKAATKELFAEDIKMMKRAHMAQRTIKECDILKRALYTSYEPSNPIKKI